eukprot:2312-Prymnesium_polylepis.2
MSSLQRIASLISLSDLMCCESGLRSRYVVASTTRRSGVSSSPSGIGSAITASSTNPSHRGWLRSAADISAALRKAPVGGMPSSASTDWSRPSVN